MRIAYIITRADAVGGASIHVRDLARAVRDRGHEVLVLVGGHGPVTDQLEAAGVAFGYYGATISAGDGTDAALWLAQPVNDRWGYSVLAGQHWQARSDIDGDGWTDLPTFRRTQVRPRVSWNNGGGRSVFATISSTAAVLNATRAGVLCSHAKASISGTQPARAAKPATSNGMNTRKPVAAARPMPSATLRNSSKERFTKGNDPDRD